MTSIKWFPGHMAKTIKALKEQLNLCDSVIEVTDARFPESGRNPELQKLINHKKRILFLNKADLADPKITNLWLDHYKNSGITVFAGDARSKKTCHSLEQMLIEMNKENLERAAARGRKTRPLKLLVAGIPNSGKSSLINSFCGRKTAATSNKPGVTRSLNWVKAGSRLLLLDSPGLLWPKLATRHEEIVLGASAAIKDDILPLEELAGELCLLLYKLYPSELDEIFGDTIIHTDGEWTDSEEGLELLKNYARKLKFIKQEGELDLHRAAMNFLYSYRSGNLGKFSLEKPKENNDN